jgi:hypothetical protein
MSPFPARLSVIFLSITVPVTPFAVMAEDVPDALSVEWQGQKPCEKLFEDDQVRYRAARSRRERRTSATPIPPTSSTC